MSSFIEQNQDLLHFCDFSSTVLKFLDQTGEATMEEISKQCKISLARAGAVLECLTQDGYIISLGEEVPRYSLRFKDPKLGCLRCHENKDKQP